jgi:uncharacterized NAD(P)/FAD-binding protein YdhS
VTDARVLVIGGGFSGAMTAAHLAGSGVDVQVIEPGVLGRGLAYAATPYPLLLNTPVSAMSALRDVPRHFETWLERHDARLAADAAAPPTAGAIAPGPVGGELPHRRGDEFVPRALYGDYLEHTISDVSRGGLDVVRARATSLDRSATGFTVRCDDGRTLTAPSVVLALGNAPPRRPPAVASLASGDERYQADPYRAIAAIEPTDPVAILGTGLTALDVLAALRARGHRGRIVCVSRRGLVPIAHGARPLTSFSVPRELVRQPRLHALLSWWRERLERSAPVVGGRSQGMRSAGAAGGATGQARRGFDAAVCEVALIAALRPFLPTIWRRLPLADRARFQRHIRPRWDVIRHRAPPAVRAAVDTGLAAGSLEILAGRLATVASTAAGLRCEIAAADGQTVVREARWLVNCTGPERDVRRLTSPLVRSLLDRRLIAPDPLGLGVLTGPSGQLIGEDGFIPDAFVVGPWRMADLWEATAVPELRYHVADTAATIAGPLALDTELQQVG